VFLLDSMLDGVEQLMCLQCSREDEGVAMAWVRSWSANGLLHWWIGMYSVWRRCPKTPTMLIIGPIAISVSARLSRRHATVRARATRRYSPSCSFRSRHHVVSLSARAVIREIGESMNRTDLLRLSRAISLANYAIAEANEP
jgi:hypothetical protein